MIKIENLVKLFGSKRAVDDVSFTVGKGEVLGFLGPNGAGKSTTMRMITGFIPPDSGSIRIGEFDMLTDPIRAKQTLGYLPENAPLYTDMTVYGFLNFAPNRGLRGAERKKVVQSAVETCFWSLSSIKMWIPFPKAFVTVPALPNPSSTIQISHSG